jgi:hypothetical protein
MIKIRLPYSLMTIVLAIAFQLPMWGAAILGCIEEFGLASLLLIKLRSSDHFDYDSFYGHILQQFTIINSVSVYEIGILVGARLVMMAIAGFIWPSLWVIVPGLLYLGTMVHYKKAGD